VLYLAVIPGYEETPGSSDGAGEKVEVKDIWEVF
jgi:hypothetical protein